MQRQLGFDDAEAAAGQRRSDLWMALAELAPDCWTIHFVDWIYRHGTRGQPLEMVAQRIYGGPWGLACGETKLRTIVRRLIDAGLIERTSGYDPVARRECNAYRIDWDGVRRIRTADRSAAAPPDGGSAGRRGGSAGRGVPAPGAGGAAPGAATSGMGGQPIHPAPQYNAHPPAHAVDKDDKKSTSTLTTATDGELLAGLFDRVPTWPAVLDLAGDVLAAIYRRGGVPPVKPRDRSLLLKAAWLSLAGGGRAWIDHAAQYADESRRQRRRPWACFHTDLAAGLHGQLFGSLPDTTEHAAALSRFRRVLAGVDLPEAIDQAAAGRWSRSRPAPEASPADTPDAAAVAAWASKLDQRRASRGKDS